MSRAGNAENSMHASDSTYSTTVCAQQHQGCSLALQYFHISLDLVGTEGSTHGFSCTAYMPLASRLCDPWLIGQVLRCR